MAHQQLKLNTHQLQIIGPTNLFGAQEKQIGANKKQFGVVEKLLNPDQMYNLVTNKFDNGKMCQLKNLGVQKKNIKIVMHNKQSSVRRFLVVE